jgi:internalin A
MSDNTLENMENKGFATIKEFEREIGTPILPDAMMIPPVLKEGKDDERFRLSFIMDFATSRPVESIEDMETMVLKDEYIEPDKKINNEGLRKLLAEGDIKYLDLSHCYNITDFTPLKDHKSLIQLTLSENKVITDASFLSGLENLQVLNLGGTHITDVSFVKNLKKLQIFNIRYTDVKDISTVGELPDLRDFVMMGCEKISDLSPLANCKELRLVDAQDALILTDISFVKHTPKIENLMFDFCPIKTMEPLKEAYTLKFVSFESSSHYIPNITESFRNLTNLQYLNLRKNQIQNVEPLKNLTKLIILNVGFNKFTDVSPLRDMTEIRRLYIDENPGVVDISSLNNYPNINLMDVSGDRITDISVMSTYKNMTRLDMNDNILISDLSPLTPLENLTEVYINRSFKVSDISCLKNKKTFRIFRCNFSLRITDLSPLKGKEKLVEISANSTNVPCYQIPELKSSLDLSILKMDRSSEEYRRVKSICNIRRKLILLRNKLKF